MLEKVIKHQTAKFVSVGLIVVLFDLTVYSVVLAAGGAISTSKAIGFACGVILSFGLNSSWTFGTNPTLRIFIEFIFLYSCSMLMNIGVNAIIISNFGMSYLVIGTAFFLSTGTSTIINFIGMKFYVFRPSKS